MARASIDLNAVYYCPKCDGSAQVKGKTCPVCKGHGWARKGTEVYGTRPPKDFNARVQRIKR